MLTADRLREALDYDPTTGIFRWKIRRAGSIAGVLTEGRIKIKLDGRIYMAHRLAHLWMTGQWPADEIDHRNIDASNNRWENLREATSGQNKANRKVRKDSQSGLKGAYYDRRRGKYKAHIARNGRQFHLGYFDTAEDAHKVHVEAATALNGEYAGS